jgi:hypothetical protein
MSKSEKRRPSDTPAPRDPRDPRPLLARILDTPHLAVIVPRLQPEVLHRVIAHVGLEDCGELVSLATPAQLTGVFDLDLWRSERPGLDEQFDAERFGVWVEVLLESGPAVAARTLAGLDSALATAALAQYVLVFDPAAISLSGEMSGEDAPIEHAPDTPDTGLGCEIGGYLVAARRAEAWDAIVQVLTSLDADHQETFHRVMRGCRRLSNSTPEVDGLDDLLMDAGQAMFDLATDREQRRERQGFATPAEARAFLQLSRQPSDGHEGAPSGNPIAAAYFRHIEEATAQDAHPATSRLPASSAPLMPDDSASAAALLVDVLVAEGVLPQPPRALLARPDGRTPRLALIQAHMGYAHNRDAASYLIRTQELAFLANTLLAGCSIQARPFTLQEASDAAVAVCNLGLENPPAHWVRSGPRPGSAVADTTSLPEDFLVSHDLVGVFQAGWRVLHQQVCMYAADRLISVLKRLRCDDREIQAGLGALRRDLMQHRQSGEPWRARDALDVITSLDMPAWAALLGLIAECPVMHAGIAASQGTGMRQVSASAFEFISENSQITSVRAFMEALPLTLSG